MDFSQAFVAEYKNIVKVLLEPLFDYHVIIDVLIYHLYALNVSLVTGKQTSLQTTSTIRYGLLRMDHDLRITYLLLIRCN